MMTRFTSLWHRFCRDEAGNTNTVAFAIWMPMFLMTLATAFEIGLYTARATMLERAVDMVTRDIRIATGFTPDHTEIKTEICQRASLIPNCEANLTLEMEVNDLRAWTPVSSTATCTDRAEQVAPVTAFVNGQANQLMVLRACAKVTPVLPLTYLSEAIATDDAGDYAIIATNAFVQEPR